MAAHRLSAMVIAMVAVVTLVTIPLPCSAQATGSLSIDNGSGLPGATVVLLVTMTNDTPADGFSFGVVHDGGLFSADAIRLGPILDPLQGGIEPDAFFPDLAPAGGPGITVGCLVDFGPPPFVTIPIGVDEVIVEIEYSIALLSKPEISPLTFSPALGSPPVEILLVLNTEEVVPGLTDGSIEVLPIPFQRGDCNQNGTVNLVDAVVCLQRQFMVLPPGTCDDADDIDDNGLIEVTDTVFLLDFLFNSGPPVPAPVGTCDVDGTLDTLECNSFSACP